MKVNVESRVYNHGGSFKQPIGECAALSVDLLGDDAERRLQRRLHGLHARRQAGVTQRSAPITR